MQELAQEIISAIKALRQNKTPPKEYNSNEMELLLLASLMEEEGANDE